MARVVLRGKVGYPPMDRVEVAPDPVEIGMMKANAGMNVREKPSTNARILGAIRAGTVVSVTDKFQQVGNIRWRQVVGWQNQAKRLKDQPAWEELAGWIAEAQGNKVYLVWIS